MKRWIYTLLLLAVTLPAAAQKYPERALVRKGNRDFAKERYDRSIDRYKRALERTPGTWEATYNLGNALYRTEQYDAAVQALQAAAADTLRSREERAEAWFNLGDVQFGRQQLKESLEAFRQALRLVPGDEEAKYNYAYVKRLLDQQQEDQNQDGGGQDQQDQNQDQNRDQDRNENGGDGQEGNQDQEQQQDPGERDPDDGTDPDEPRDGEGAPQPAEGRISPQEQERMLEAIQAQEDETQEKLKEKAGVVVRGRKNW